MSEKVYLDHPTFQSSYLMIQPVPYFPFTFLDGINTLSNILQNLFTY